MKIHIVRASGSGVTTLGKHLSVVAGMPYFDSDTYYWEKTLPPFTQRREVKQRDQMVEQDLMNQLHWILGGSLLNWGEHWITAFDLVVFLWIPASIRMQRLKEREEARYGACLLPGNEMYRRHREFMEWAAGYDDNSARGRTLAAHERWLQRLTCAALELKGDFSVQERTEMILDKISQMGRGSQTSL